MWGHIESCNNNNNSNRKNDNNTTTTLASSGSNNNKLDLTTSTATAPTIATAAGLQLLHARENEEPGPNQPPLYHVIHCRTIESRHVCYRLNDTASAGTQSPGTQPTLARSFDGMYYDRDQTGYTAITNEL